MIQYFVIVLSFTVLLGIQGYLFYHDSLQFKDLNTLFQNLSKSDKDMLAQIDVLKTSLKTVAEQVQLDNIDDLKLTVKQTQDQLKLISQQVVTNNELNIKLQPYAMTSSIQGIQSNLEKIQVALSNVQKNLDDSTKNTQKSLDDSTKNTQKNLDDSTKNIQKSFDDVTKKVASLQQLSDSFQKIDVKQLQVLIQSFPELQNVLQTLQKQIVQSQTINQANQVSQLKQKIDTMQLNFINVISHGAIPSTNGISTTAAGDLDNAINLLQLTTNSKGKAITSYDHKDVAGWSSGLDAKDQNKYKIGPQWDTLDNAAISINNPNTQKNKFVGINNQDPRADLHISGTTISDKYRGSGYPNQNSQVQAGLVSYDGDPENKAGLAIRAANNDSDIKLSLRTGGGSKKPSYVSYDHEGIIGWSTGQSPQQNDSYIISNQWDGLDGQNTQRLKIGKDGSAQFNVSGFNLCDVQGQNCKKIY